MSDHHDDVELVQAEVRIVDEESFDPGLDTADREFAERGRKEYGETELKQVRCPLFLLASPSVAGCKTTLTLSGSGTGGWGLELKLFGNGVSLGKKLTVSLSQEVTASAGKRHRVFLPLWLDVQEVTTYFDDGREEQVGYEHTLRWDKMSLNQIGVETLAGWAAAAGGVRLLAAYLKDNNDTEPVTQKFSYALESSGDFQVGFKAFDADQTLKVEATATQSLEFAAQLMPGHDYLGTGGAWPPSVSWTVDGVAG